MYLDVQLACTKTEQMQTNKLVLSPIGKGFASGDQLHCSPCLGVQHYAHLMDGTIAPVEIGK